MKIENLLDLVIKEYNQLTTLQKRTFNFLFGQLMKANPNLKVHDNEKGEGAITLLKRKLDII